MQNSTDITIILDRSGSMDSCKTDTIGGFNSFVQQQRSTGVPTVITLVQFDNVNPYDVIYNATPINMTSDLTSEKYTPRGLTPLLDAIGTGIKQTGYRLSYTPESQRPNVVIFVIITDGLENHSTNYTRQEIFDMVSHQRDKYNWQFVFLGANQDAIAEAARYNIPTMAAITYDTKRTRSAYRSLGNLVAFASESGGAATIGRTTGFTTEDRINALDTVSGDPVTITTTTTTSK